MPRNRIAETLAASAPPTTNSSAPPPKQNGEHESPGTFNAILQQAETAKTALHDALPISFLWLFAFDEVAGRPAQVDARLWW